MIFFLEIIFFDLVVDKNLNFFGFVFEIVVDIENENEVLFDLIDMNLEEFDYGGYLYFIN